ncbi:hypothetical protein AgCh_018092 [Apium graveolens]
MMIQDYHVHAFVSGSVWQWWNEVIHEGSVYELIDFMTVDVARKMRHVSSAIKIIFTHVITGQRIVNPPVNIPMQKFELKTLKSLYNSSFFDERKDIATFLSDVVGVVSNIQQVRNIAIKYGKRILFRFDLEDQWHSIKVNKWDSIIGDVPQKLQSIVNEPAIIIIASCKNGLYCGNILLSSIPFTKIYINLAHDTVNNRRERIKEPEVEEVGIAQTYKFPPIERRNALVIKKPVVERVETSRSFSSSGYKGTRNKRWKKRMGKTISKLESKIIRISRNVKNLTKTVEMLLWKVERDLSDLDNNVKRMKKAMKKDKNILKKILMYMGMFFHKNWKAIGRDVFEGHVYRFDNFTVRDTVGKLKPVSTNLCIRLLGSTIIQRVEDDGMIPRYKFEFIDLADLEEEKKHLGDNEKLEFAADLIGVIDEYEKVNRISTKYRPKDVVRFMLTDGR